MTTEPTPGQLAAETELFLAGHDIGRKLVQEIGALGRSLRTQIEALDRAGVPADELMKLRRGLADVLRRAANVLDATEA